MRYSNPNYGGIHSLVFIVLAVTWLLPQSILGRPRQSSNKPPVDPASAPPRVKAIVEAMNQRARELGLIAVSDDPDQAAFVRRRRDAQLSEDFEKLYSINVEKIAAHSAAPVFDYKALQDVSADLKNRATRIKYCVPVLQVADKGEKVRYDENRDDLRVMLADLSRLINSVLGSPVFRIKSPDDAALRLKASRDLESIIKLSDAISKIARRSINKP
jgi:hypothetical protein